MTRTWGRVTAALAGAAALIAASPTPHSDVQQLGREHRAATARAQLFATFDPHISMHLQELVDDVYSARFLAAAPQLQPAADSADTAAEITSRELVEALAAAAAADPAPARPAETTDADTNFDGLPPAGQFVAAPDGYTCPVAGPHTFINDWGFPRSGGRVHRGNDLFANTGTPVVSVEPGTVVRINRHDRWTPGARVGLGGRTVTIAGTDTTWYYAHLDEIAAGLEVGDTVGTGEPVGTVGTSGNARFTPPHLHIEQHVNGTAVNPYPLLVTLCASALPAAENGRP